MHFLSKSPCSAEVGVFPPWDPEVAVLVLLAPGAAAWSCLGGPRLSQFHHGELRIIYIFGILFTDVVLNHLWEQAEQAGPRDLNLMLASRLG